MASETLKGCFMPLEVVPDLGWQLLRSAEPF